MKRAISIVVFFILWCVGINGVVSEGPNLKYRMNCNFWFTVKHQSQTQIAQITPQLLQLRSFCFFRAILTICGKCLLMCYFVIRSKSGEHSTAYDALITVLQRDFRFMHMSCCTKYFNQIFWNCALL